MAKKIEGEAEQKDPEPLPEKATSAEVFDLDAYCKEVLSDPKGPF